MRIAAIASMKRGLEQFIYRELEHIERAGAEITLLATKMCSGPYNPRPSWRVHSWSPLRALLWQPWYFLRSPLKYMRLLAHAVQMRALSDFIVAWDFAQSMRDADVIYATFGDHKFFIGYFCKRILDKPLAVELHAYELYSNPNPTLFVHALAHCDQIITVSHHNREYLQAHFGIDPKRVEIVRYSVDMGSYCPAEKFVILIVAFFVERKGHEILLQAVQQLANPDIEVWVVGDEGAEDSWVDVRGWTRKLGLEDQVAFFGRQSGTALRSLFHACDVFCLPCRFDSSGIAEGFPNVLIEAMAVGKPVITTRHVEIPRVIPELLVDENDVPGLAAAIQKVYDSQPLRQRLGKQNRQIAENTFSVRNAAQTKAILERLTVQRQMTDDPVDPIEEKPLPVKV